MYEKALDCNISIRLFWESSLQEIYDMLNSYNRKRELAEKIEVSRQFMLAQLIGEYVHSLLNKDIVFSKPWDFYPNLFEKEKEERNESTKQKEIDEYKEKRMKYMQEFNQKFRMNREQSKE